MINKNRAAAAIVRAVIDQIELAKMNKTEIDTGMDRKEIVGQLGDSG
jgi:hypothetical protein